MRQSNPIALAAACLAALLVFHQTAANAQPTEAVPARQQATAFTAPTIGVRMPFPEGTRFGGVTGEDGLGRYFLPDGRTVRLYMRSMKRGATPEQLMERSIEQVGFLEPRAAIVEQRKLELADRTGVRLTFRLPEKNNQPEWLLSLAVVPTELDAALLIRGETDIKGQQTNDQWFDRMIEGAAFEPMQAVAVRRAEQLELGDRWINAVKAEHLAAALVPERWFRIVDAQGNDRGYQRVVQRPSRVMGFDGVSVEVRTRLDQSRQRSDTTARYFMSNDLEQEFWTIETAVRARVSNDQPVQTQAFTETGLRSQVIMTVVNSTPVKDEEKKWPLPHRAYLPRLTAELIGSLLPRDAERRFAFYSYNSQQKKIDLVVYEVRPGEDGSYRVLRYARPGVPPEVNHYNADGVLRKTVTGEGLVITPIDPDQLRAVWDEPVPGETDADRLRRMMRDR